MAKANLKASITQRQILQALTSPDPEEQRAGWDTLYHRLHGGALRPDAQFAKQVVELTPTPQHPAVKTSMSRAIEELYSAMSNLLTDGQPLKAGFGGKPGGGAGLATGGLGSWLWTPYQDRSWLLRLIDARARDERAALIIGRRLSYEQFSAVQWRELKPHGFTFAIDVNQPPKAIVFLGRPNLFFAPTEPRARWEMKNACYRFADAMAAGDWPDPDFHCIYEPLGAGLPPRTFRTRLVGNELTDYGLVQRFLAHIDGVAVVVLVIAGATFAGTYAAAYWAACSLFDDSEKTPIIQLPKEVDRKSEFEALIEVQAILDEDVTRQPRIGTILRALNVAGKQWNQDTRKWEKAAPRDIVLVTRQTDRPTPQEIEEIWLNGRPARVRDQREARRLLAAVSLHAQHHPGVNSFEVLLDDSGAAAATPQALERLRHQLRALRQRHLGSVLELTDSGWQLKARVHLTRK